MAVVQVEATRIRIPITGQVTRVVTVFPIKETIRTSRTLHRALIQIQTGKATVQPIKDRTGWTKILIRKTAVTILIIILTVDGIVIPTREAQVPAVQAVANLLQEIVVVAAIADRVNQKCTYVPV